MPNLEAPTDAKALDPKALDEAMFVCARISDPEMSREEYDDHKARLSKPYTATLPEIEEIIVAYLATLASQPAPDHAGLDRKAIVADTMKRFPKVMQALHDSEKAAALAAKEAECEALRVELAATQEANDINIGAWRVQREASEAKLKRIRAETIEECARMADRTPPIGNDILNYAPPHVVAAAIRTLASEDSAE